MNNKENMKIYGENSTSNKRSKRFTTTYIRRGQKQRIGTVEQWQLNEKRMTSFDKNVTV